MAIFKREIFLNIEKNPKYFSYQELQENRSVANKIIFFLPHYRKKPNTKSTLRLDWSG
jgi:hypothetical protein